MTESAEHIRQIRERDTTIARQEKEIRELEEQVECQSVKLQQKECEIDDLHHRIREMQHGR